MNFESCLSKMVAPGVKRPGKYLGGVIQILVTSVCDKSCSYCTQASNLRRKPYFMSIEGFERAVISLKDYFGVVGMFGGNPATHPRFEELCSILRKHIPYKRRGIWCNNPLGKGVVMRDTFCPSVCNLNVHLDSEAYAEFKRDWPESNPVGLHTESSHSPVYISPTDLGYTEDEIWEGVSDCDINQHWSAIILEILEYKPLNSIEYLGYSESSLLAYFCEVAGAQDLLRYRMHKDNSLKEVDPSFVREAPSGLPVALYRRVGDGTFERAGSILPPQSDTGIGMSGPASAESTQSPPRKPKPGKPEKLYQWWEMPMEAFKDQVSIHCRHCGVPLKVRGMNANERGIENTSKSYFPLYRTKRNNPVVGIQSREEMIQLGLTKVRRVTDYLRNSENPKKKE